MIQLKFTVPQQHREQTRLLLPGLQNHMTTYPECPCHICHSSWLPGSLLPECQRNTGTRHFAAGPPCPISGSGISLCCCSLQWKVFTFILLFLLLFWMRDSFTISKITFVQCKHSRSVLHIYEAHTYQPTLNLYRTETILLFSE